MARLKIARFGRGTGSDGMLVKAIILFLCGMALVAFIGRVLFPSALPKLLRKKAAAPVCAKCGRYLIGAKSCDCGDRPGGGKAK